MSHRRSLSSSRVSASISYKILCGMLCGLVYCGAVMALPALPDVIARLNSSDIVWGRADSMTAGGVPLDTVPFSSSLLPASLAESLSSPDGPFQRVLTTPGGVVLSGLEGSRHVIANIRRHASGSQGYLSAMYFDVDMDMSSSARRFSWLPHNAAPVFSHSEGRGALLHEGYHVASPASALRHHVSIALRAQGWRYLDGHDVLDGIWRWHRRGEHLTLHAMPGSQGTTLFIQHERQGTNP